MMSAAVAGASPERRRRRREKVPDGDRTSSGDERVRVKLEPDDDIKDYAETTMNELLGWYGYDKVDTRGINLRGINNFPSSSSSSSPTTITRHEDDMSEEEEDTGQSLSPHVDSEPSVFGASASTIICDWCKKSGLKLFTLKTATETKAFCSEPCFSQCRRAAFKKSRICDWCKHVRHTVNYVDFQDGDHQLQFCSDKCLNQYKMHIFCKETQAYLQMHPQLQEAAKNSGSATSKLITPDLWLRDCHEPVNGNQRHEPRSDDEKATSAVVAKPSNSSGELEDLTVVSKSSERSNSSSSNPMANQERESQHEKKIDTSKRPAELYNSLPSHIRADKDRSYSERRKRLHDNDKEHHRKRERLSSPRHKSNHLLEAPPAHLSSQSPISYAAPQCRMFPTLSTSPFPHSLNSSSPLNPPAAHSNALQLHPSLSAPTLPPGLPPPPPLLNNEFMHQQAFNPPFYQPPFNLLPQHQIDALLRMQAGLGLRHNSPMFPPHLPQHSFPELVPPQHANPQYSTPSSIATPNTIMLPYPVIVPLPVPIPIPIPLSHLLKVAQNAAAKKDASNTKVTSESEQSKMPVTSASSKSLQDLQKKNIERSIDSAQCKSSNNDEGNDRDKPQTAKAKSSYAVTNNDSEANRMILTRTKTKHDHEDKTSQK